MTASTTARPTIVRTSVALPLPAACCAALGAASCRSSGVASPSAAKAPAGTTTRPHRAAVRERVNVESDTGDPSGDRRPRRNLERLGHTGALAPSPGALKAELSRPADGDRRSRAGAPPWD